MRYVGIFAGIFALNIGMAGCFGPTSKIAYRQDTDGVHTRTTATFKLKPGNVYEAALRVLAKSQENIILTRDDAHRYLIVSKNYQNVCIDVSPRGNGSRLTVVSDAGHSTSPSTDQAIITMQEICAELGAPCTLPHE